MNQFMWAKRIKSMTEIEIVALLVMVMLVCFAISRVIKWRGTPPRRFGYFEIEPNQQGTKQAYTGYGTPRPDDRRRIPLRVREWKTDENEKVLGKKKRGTRYFEKQ